MSPQFQHMAATVIVASSIIFGVGALLLIAAFRAFRNAKRGDVLHIVLMVVAIAFILFSCVGLLVWSSLQRG